MSVRSTTHSDATAARQFQCVTLTHYTDTHGCKHLQRGCFIIFFEFYQSALLRCGQIFCNKVKGVSLILHIFNRIAATFNVFAASGLCLLKYRTRHSTKPPPHPLCSRLLYLPSVCEWAFVCPCLFSSTLWVKSLCDLWTLNTLNAGEIKQALSKQDPYLNRHTQPFHQAERLGPTASYSE